MSAQATETGAGKRFWSTIDQDDPDAVKPDPDAVKPMPPQAVVRNMCLDAALLRSTIDQDDPDAVKPDPDAAPQAVVRNMCLDAALLRFNKQ